jgi:methyl-accepting chemotaxis protein
MSIAKKVFFVAASFALPIIVLAFLLVRGINEHIAFARYELAGTAYQRPLEALLWDLQDQQLLLQSCPKGRDCPGQAAALTGTIRQELAALRAADRRYGPMLQFTGEGLAKRGRQLATAENLERGWRRAEALCAEGSSPELDAQYDKLAGMIQTMITHLGDMSNLILDPELDTFHLITDTLVLLPKTQARFTRVIAAGREALAHGRLSSADRSALAAYAAFLEEEDRDQIKAHLGTALSENKNEFHGVSDSFQKNVPIAYEEYEAAADRFIALTKRVAGGGRPAVPARDYVAAGVKAREASFRLWDAAVPELDRLLQARIDYYAKRKAVALLLSGLALLLACLLAYRIAASLIDPLNRISRTLTPGADLLDGSVQKLADFTEKGAQDLTSMRITCDELDAHAENMRKTAQALAAVVFGDDFKA